LDSGQALDLLHRLAALTQELNRRKELA
jgi:hypothetical protein